MECTSQKFENFKELRKTSNKTHTVRVYRKNVNKSRVLICGKGQNMSKNNETIENV